MEVTVEVWELRKNMHCWLLTSLFGSMYKVTKVRWSILSESNAISSSDFNFNLDF